MLPKPAPRSPPANPAAAAAGLKCPRCDSANTKFCYYNNYSLSQPRHFCKSCKRYWTRGGTLRNVPVGGATRKKSRSKKHARSSITASAAAGIPPSVPPPPITDVASLFYNSQFRGFEGNPQSTFHGHYSLLSSQFHSDGYQSLFSYDGIPIPVEDNSLKRSIQWQAIRENPMEPVPSDSSYFYWNQSEGGGWRPAGSSTFLT